MFHYVNILNTCGACDVMLNTLSENYASQKGYGNITAKLFASIVNIDCSSNKLFFPYLVIFL